MGTEWVLVFTFGLRTFYRTTDGDKEEIGRLPNADCRLMVRLVKWAINEITEFYRVSAACKVPHSVRVDARARHPQG